MNNAPQTIAMETYAQRSYNYLGSMVDGDGLPYFNIFWTEPAQAAHDWPDFGDVMSRQLQAAVMGRHMTGEELPNEKVWYRKILSLLDPQDGLLYRPATSFSQHVADAGDAALTLYALVTAYVDDRDAALGKAICKMVDSLVKRAGQPVESSFLGGFGIKSLMACARFMGYEPAAGLAEKLVRDIFFDHPLFSPDNNFRHGGHMHGNLRCLVGAADFALYTCDPVLFSRVDALYRYVRSQATRFGFLPEVIGRQADIILCETCALMDFLGLAVTLANSGHPEYWGDVERMARNQLIESQVTDLSWITVDSSRQDTEQFTWRAIDQRMVGGYAGWSSPNHLLAARECLNAHWGGPELHNKTRLFQNCCGGSGTHAFFTVWKNASRFEDGCLSVNMHIDKLLPQAEVRGYQPFAGKTTIHLYEACRVKVRIPEFTSASEVRASAAGIGIPARAWGNYLELEEQPVGTLIEIDYPLPVMEEEVTIGNPGFRQYHYRATWKGDTVLKMEPLGNEYATGYSDFDKKQVPIFYGTEGPGPLYQRQDMLEDQKPALAPLHEDTSSLDFWAL
jgi:hypothetical protein